MSDEINMRLFRAAARGSLDHALLAIEAGAEINARDYNNHTALHIAKSRNHLELADRLTTLGAECDASELAERSICKASIRESHKQVTMSRFGRCVSQPFQSCINAEAALASNFPASWPPP